MMDKLDMHTDDLAAANLNRLAELFPSAITEMSDDDGNIVRGVDFDLLRQELAGRVVDGPRERYQLDWPGKRSAAFAANAPIAKTLRPDREESVGFDTTKNLFIEGDNLDALKLLQESYLGKVKLIYIDPPYNTGKDFVYNDRFAETTDEYLTKSGQVDTEGNRLVANTESNGRFHSDWLSMMYPRLKLARNLLTDDGIIAVSIDDHEVQNLRQIMSHVFGGDNFINAFIWISNLKGRQISGRGAATTKEYLLCYARKTTSVMPFRAKIDALKSKMPSVYKGFNYEVQEDAIGPYVIKNQLYNSNSSFNEQTRPNLVFDIYYQPDDGTVTTEPSSDAHIHPGSVKVPPKTNNNGVHRYHAFRWSRKKVESEAEDLEFVNSPLGWRVYTKVRQVDTTIVKDVILGISTSEGSSDIDLLGLPADSFDYPKPVSLLRLVCEMVAHDESIVLDFFAGSSTTAHACLLQSATDGVDRRFIMVQIPEPLRRSSEAAKAGYGSVSEVSKERIRRAGSALLEGAAHGDWDRDVGFRALKVDSTNLADVLRTPDEVGQDDLAQLTDSVKLHRDPEDLLFQVLVDWGLELTLSIEHDNIDGHDVHAVDHGALIACFAPNVTQDVARAIAQRQPLRAVFRDDAFPGDAARINVEQIFAEASPTTDIRTI